MRAVLWGGCCGARGPARYRRLPVCAATLILSYEAMARSKVSNCVPVASNIFRFGSWRRKAPGNGVRSRMHEMMVKGFSRLMMAC